MTTEKQKFLSSLKNKLANGLRYVNYYVVNGTCNDEAVYAELNRMNEAKDEEDVEVLGKYSKNMNNTQAADINFRQAVYQNNETPTVASLRRLGCAVRVCHFRRVHNGYGPAGIESIEMALPDIRRNKLSTKILAKGGRTVIEIKDPNGNNYKGETVCSKHDAFCRKEGIKFAIEKALKAK